MPGGRLANQRFERFQSDFECIDLPTYVFDTAEATPYLQPEDPAYEGLKPPDLFHCGLAIDHLPCERVHEYGDDLWRYLEASDACAWVVKPKGGR